MSLGSPPNGGKDTRTMTADDIRLDWQDGLLQVIDVSAAGDLILPQPNGQSGGKCYIRHNTGAASITVKQATGPTSAGGSLGVIAQKASAICWCDGNQWTVLVGAPRP